jgi:hypothetical protein
MKHNLKQIKMGKPHIAPLKQLSLLPSGPGEVDCELVVQDLPGAKLT